MHFPLKMRGKHSITNIYNVAGDKLQTTSLLSEAI